ncbi:MAG: hypothetical protein A2Y72_00790 [Chloroflexi bacterium RBG_13_53_26]|nr:MAG: hypothetical protein A2Y72_00790 [Chloroflexi bacterium RBG_13_53_26]
MTLSSDRGTELTVDEIILTAYQQCGIMSVSDGPTSPQWEGKILFARRRLDAIIDEIVTTGGCARSTEFYDLALSADTYRYDLPAYSLDVEGDGMYMDASVTDTTKAAGETAIKSVARETWHLISAKDAEGRPSLMYVHRAASPLQVWFWPIPDEAGTVRLPIRQVSTDVYEGDKTVDLRSYWTDYITFRLAYVLALANNLSIETCRELRNEAKELRKKADMYSNDHTDNQIHVSHGRRN